MVGAVDANTTPAARIPFHRPLLPRAEALLPYLRQIDGQNIYTNQGPLYRAFQRRLALRWQPGTHCVPVASGTAGIVLALLATGAWRPGLCLVPAWSFRATWNAVRLAGLVPVPVDVSADSWQIEPDAAEAVAAEAGAAGRLRRGGVAVRGPGGPRQVGGVSPAHGHPRGHRRGRGLRSPGAEARSRR